MEGVLPSLSTTPSAYLNHSFGTDDMKQIHNVILVRMKPQYNSQRYDENPVLTNQILGSIVKHYSLITF